MKRLFPLVALVVLGCGKKEAPVVVSTPKKPVAPPHNERQNITTGAGETVTFSKDAAREKLYTARWKDAQVSIGEKGVRSVRMTEVNGEMFKKSQRSATYRADGGRTVDGTDVLALAGRVRVESREPGAVLTCDRLEYHPARGAVRAVGDVRLNSGPSRVEGFDELWMSDDLRTFGTRDLFPLKKR